MSIDRAPLAFRSSDESIYVRLVAIVVPTSMPLVLAPDAKISLASFSYRAGRAGSGASSTRRLPFQSRGPSVDEGRHRERSHGRGAMIAGRRHCVRAHGLPEDSLLTPAPMDDTSDTDSRPAAFIAAALVLVALPLVILIGVVALALATKAGILPGLGGDIVSGQASWLTVAILIVWVLVAVGVVLKLALRVGRRPVRR
jgi:hypothetical protein